ncbi:hypothetical protein [Pseudovibrio sp. Tun.PSC04-5.I4]|uniref:hypothetical protein n=1 Tax=Pseudovibrio sp. Tun.PSC04-5.I4 TaxID=1798213 RepID=UPI000B8705CD|nr:hypothetical protein [Pseudovibrio sp. Tun.PSC04-5.I4]
MFTADSHRHTGERAWSKRAFKAVSFWQRDREFWVCILGKTQTIEIGQCLTDPAQLIEAQISGFNLQKICFALF